MPSTIRRPSLRLVAAFFFFCAFPACAGQERDGWQPMLVARFGNIDALDAEDGDLASFLRDVRNDGRFTPPMKTLVGGRLRNPTFYGLVYEAWIECVVAAPLRVGDIQTVWLFPVESRDEYLLHVASQGMAEYEGMDGVTVLREMDADANVAVWHLEWLPGNVAVFGADRSAVAAVRRYYAENGASRGLLAGMGGRFMEPDVTLRLHPGALAAWQNREPGRYWLRDRIDLMARDLVAYWEPGTARRRLIDRLSDDLAAWARGFSRLDLGVWFVEDGVDCRLEAEGDFAPSPPRSQLDILRRTPEQSAWAYALPVDRNSLGRYGAWVGRLLLDAAGGVVNPEASTVAADLMAAVLAAEPSQVAVACVAPPVGSPELGAAAMVVAECARPEGLAAFRDTLVASLTPGAALAQALSQIGLEASITPAAEADGTAEILVRPFGRPEDEPYCRATVAWRAAAGRVALVCGGTPADDIAVEAVRAYRAGLADSAATSARADGARGARAAFTRMGAGGASMVAFLHPVRLLQTAFIEAADWRPRSPDQHEPESTRLAREFLEYGTAAAWAVAGERDGGVWRFDGGIPWASLSRLAAALGVTESVDFE